MDIRNIYHTVIKQVKSIYRRVNHFTGGVLDILRWTIERFGMERGPEAAASLAYYAFFSIFPMLLVFIVVGSFFIDQDLVEAQLLHLLQDIIPGVEEVIIGNIEQVLELRGAVTFIALISLIWSATSVFNILAKNINRAFPQANVPSFFKGRIIGLLMILGLGFLMLLSFATSTFSGLVPVINIPFNDKALHETFLWQIGAFLVPVGTNFLMFWAIYQWVPLVKVDRKATFFGGLVAGVAWELLNNVFTWYLSSGLSQYSLVYGSVGTVVALLFWIYLTAMITLIGAHLTASIQRAIDQKT
ncbi:MAG: YihY/virulence factor BrkB family protein [Brevefilum sp.]|jgi:membrane protein